MLVSSSLHNHVKASWRPLCRYVMASTGRGDKNTICTKQYYEVHSFTRRISYVNTKSLSDCTYQLTNGFSRIKENPITPILCVWAIANFWSQVFWHSKDTPNNRKWRKKGESRSHCATTKSGETYRGNASSSFLLQPLRHILPLRSPLSHKQCDTIQEATQVI